MSQVVIYGVRTDYVHEVTETLVDIGVDFELIDNLDDSSAFDKLSGRPFLLAAGSPRGRRELDSEAKNHLMTPHPAVAHSTASISPSASLGLGTTVNRLVAIGSHTSIGSHVQINRSVSIGHGVTIGDFVSFGPGVVLTGNVAIGSFVFLGAGCIVLPGVKIGEGSIVGAGAVVTKDVPKGVTVIGVPALERQAD